VFSFNIWYTAYVLRHLIHQNHHQHLKKRSILEFVGFAGLILLLIFQRDIIFEAIETVSEVHVVWFALLLACYWLILPLTAISYKLITPKPKKLRLSTTMLAHLAGAGPGRVIPGGIGGVSINSIHLKKSGLSIEQAIGVVLTNNLAGVMANLSLVAGALIIRPETLEILTENISSQQLLIAAGIVVSLIVLIQWLFHARSTRKEVNKTAKQWRKIAYMFVKQPTKLCAVLLIGLIIAIIHTFMLDFSAYAVGVDMNLFDALIALSFGVAIGGILPTPGGIGGVEAGTAAALIVLGYEAPIAASIAVLFRVATYWQPLIPGTLAYLYLRERKLL
ncbi:MAG: lysylphosphatidylglycerol synthase transmembrane domain-containing protein, partial [Alphaproteobacteria bacterium]|nr:lysylphosphatidylglycerol synthase transmembrane domain-containing protein [Alphaproteobacteria bacterium]